MDIPLLTRQPGFNYSTNFTYQEVVEELRELRELEEINLENEIIYRSIPVLEKSKSEEYCKKGLKVKRSYSY